ncbi:MAG: lytic transglycosylase domain-containing protein [Elusimicrobia bacterium]|nr:lytic transglycosylase domain-containing protein [Elusimicrobiota bacterium]
MIGTFLLLALNASASPREAQQILSTLNSGEFASPLIVAPAPPPIPQAVPDEREFDEAIVGLIDELQIKDRALFNRIHSEADRIRALPTEKERQDAVNAAYPRLEKALDASAASGKFSPEGLAKWKIFRTYARQALENGTLFERAEFAGNAFDAKVQALLRKGKTILDPNRKLPEKKPEYLAIAQRIHTDLAIAGNSTALTPKQLDQAFAKAGREFGIRAEFLKYMAKTESGLRQVVPSNPAATGIMQVESVHAEAYKGTMNVSNDTITNIVFGALLRAQTDRAMAKAFANEAIAPPTDSRVVEFLGDLAYNRGPGLLKFIAKNAAAQGIDVNRFADYIGGKGGSYALLKGGASIVVLPGKGTNVDKTGKNSVLELSSEAVGRVKFSKALTAGLGDRNGDGRVDHLDVWLTRGMGYMRDPDL